jgi:hypothetical protein
MKVKAISWSVAAIIACLTAGICFVSYLEPSVQSGVSGIVAGPVEKRAFQYLGREIILPSGSLRLSIFSGNR